MRSDYFATNQGLDLINPPIRKPPGSLLIANNVEVTPEGIERTEGYERVDGQLSPSGALYWVLMFDAGQDEIEAGDSIEGDSSTATAVVLAVVLESGAWVDTDAAGYLVLGEVSGLFIDDEVILVGATPSAQANGTQAVSAANTPELDAEYTGLAYEHRRDLITAVPGSGPIRWAAYLEDVIYAGRDNAGATAQDIYKSSASGWVAINLGLGLQYSAGNRAAGEPPRTTVITGGTSGATGKLGHLGAYTGTWAGGDAAGTMQIYDVTGTFTNGETLTIGSGTATLAAAQTAQTRLPGGAGRVIDHNFFGADNRECLIVTDGVNPAALIFEDQYIEVHTGMPVDTPLASAVMDSLLWLAFPGGSLQHSVAAEPADFDPILGAGEIGLGEDINDLIVHQGGYMVATGNTRVMTVFSVGEGEYGTEFYNKAMGGAARTSAQVPGSVLFLNGVGIVSMAASDVAGAFESATISRTIKPILDGMLDRPLWAFPYSHHNQYRIIDDSGAWICATYLVNQVQGFTAGKYNFLTSSVAYTTGKVLFGATDGFVYELKGNSFDGEDIESYGKFAFNHAKSPTTLKNYMFITPEIETSRAYQINVSVEFGYGAEDYAPSITHVINRNTSGAIWDISSWDAAYWAEAVVSNTPISEFQGVAENFAIYFLATGKHAPAWKWSGVMADFELLRMKM